MLSGGGGGGGRGGRKHQAVVYDILPLEEGAGKRCWECHPRHAHHGSVVGQCVQIPAQTVLVTPSKPRQDGHKCADDLQPIYVL